MRIFKIAIVILIILLVLSGTFLLGAVTGACYVNAPSEIREPVTLKVPEGCSAGEVGVMLKNGKIIRNLMVFKLMARFTGLDRELKAGNYRFEPGVSLPEILYKLRKGEGKVRLVTVPEGLTIKQTGKLLEKKGIFSLNDFLTATSKTYIINGRERNDLEGFLYPETYDFPENADADESVRMMIAEFNRQVIPLYRKYESDLPVKMDLEKVITLASLVEREAQVPAERPVIASVYYNRLKKGILLQCDATVQYALGENKRYLTFRDLRIDSPYNTYQHRGLPPGPIASPGIDSIIAVLDPAETDYLFYVRNDVKNNGSHVFTKSLKEHEKAIRKYQR